jgi:hypothetical protein
MVLDRRRSALVNNYYVYAVDHASPAAYAFEAALGS